jgi:hypothetical protein
MEVNSAVMHEGELLLCRVELCQKFGGIPIITEVVEYLKDCETQNFSKMIVS